jgi:hypothetical protein
MEQLFSVLIGALIASILAVLFLHVSEKLKIRSEVLLEVVGFCDKTYHHFQNLHVYKNTEDTNKDRCYRAEIRPCENILCPKDVSEKEPTL